MNIIDLATKTMQNTINSAVAAVKSVVDAIKGVVDTTKTNVDSINTRTTTMNTNINTVNTNLGTPTTTASSSTSANAHAKLNFLAANMPRGIMKSVQQGLRSSGGSTGISPSETVTIPLTTINPQKAFVLLFNTSTTNNVSVDSLNANSLVVRNGSSSYHYGFSWQVIEFY